MSVSKKGSNDNGKEWRGNTTDGSEKERKN